MTVDKPPLSLWVQALSARIFGFHPLSILIPQALMGVVAAAVLTYDLVRRRFGRPAGFRRRHRAGDHADHGRHVPTQQPRRAARPVLRRGVVVRGARARGRPHRVAGAQRRLRRARLRDQDGGRAVRRTRDRRWRTCGSPPRGRLARAAPAARSAASRWPSVGLAWPLLVTLTPAADRPVDLGHVGQQHLVADLQLQRRRPSDRVRPGRRGRVRWRWWRRVRRRHRCLPPAAVRPRRPGGLAARLRRRRRPGVLVAIRLRRSDPRTGWLIAVGGAFLVDARSCSATPPGSSTPTTSRSWRRSPRR